MNASHVLLSFYVFHLSKSNILFRFSFHTVSFWLSFFIIFFSDVMLLNGVTGPVPCFNWSEFNLAVKVYLSNVSIPPPPTGPPTN